MQPMPQLDREAYVAAMREYVETMLGQVADAINRAPDGHIIAGSEEQVRDTFADLRRDAYEMAVQMRLDAAEAAFPPSGRPPDRPAAAEQGPHGPSRAHRP